MNGIKEDLSAQKEEPRQSEWEKERHHEPFPSVVVVRCLASNIIALCGDVSFVNKCVAAAPVPTISKCSTHSVHLEKHSECHGDGVGLPHPFTHYPPPIIIIIIHGRPSFLYSYSHMYSSSCTACCCLL